jgi:hypothetical protein
MEIYGFLICLFWVVLCLLDRVGSAVKEVVVQCYLKVILSWVLVAHAYNPSYLRGRDQEDCSLKPIWPNSSRYSVSKIPNTKGLAEWLKW